MPEGNPTPMPTSIMDLIKLFVSQYGSLAFGLISLVIIWLTMVVPQLERTQVSAESHRLLLEELHRITADQKELAGHIKVTAEILDRVTLRMEHP